MAKDWTDIFKKHKGRWVALADDEETVIASATTAKEAHDRAVKKGTVEPILARMPNELTAYVGTGI